MLVTLLLLAPAPSIGAAATEASVTTLPDLPDGLYAEWQTKHGAIVAQLFPEIVPLAVANFVGLAEGTIAFQHRPAGQPFYDGLAFHRVRRRFIAQGGDPLGTGEGNPGYLLPDEFSPKLKHDAPGTLAMANSGPNTNGSQFFFTLGSENRLNYKHTVFGKLVSGLRVLRRIESGDVMTSVRILRVGTTAQAYRVDDTMFARLRERTAAIPPRALELPPLVSNEAGFNVPGTMIGSLEEKLHHYAMITGVTIRIRTVAKLPETSGNTPPQGALARFHAGLAGSDPNSATLVFETLEKRWHVWLGDGLMERFGISPADAEKEPAGSRLHETNLRILAEAKKLMSLNVVSRSFEAAAAGLIEALDRPETVRQQEPATTPPSS